MEWKIVETLIVIIGLFFTIGRPILQHTQQTQKMLDQLTNHQKNLDTHSSTIDTHEKKLQDHELRLHDLEQE